MMPAVPSTLYLQSLLRAAMEASPFPPLPQELKGPLIRLSVFVSASIQAAMSIHYS